METSTPGSASSAFPPPPPPPYGSPRPRELRRRPRQGPIAGVCAGIADYFGVDVVIVRIAAVVLAFSGPGVLAYILAWIFVPAVHDDAPLATTDGAGGSDRGAQIFGIILLGVALSILWGGWWSPFRRWLFPLALIGLGAWLILRRTDPGEPGPSGHQSGESVTEAAPRPSPTTTASPSTTPSSPSASPPPWSDPTLVGGPAASPDAPTARPVDAAARRRRSMVLPSVLGALLLWAGVGFLAGVSVQTGLAIALCIVGLGFVLGAFVGGSKALILPALVLATALVATSALDLPLRGPVGERTWTPRATAELESPYELSMGDGTLDLTELGTGAEQEVAIRASVGIGHLLVVVPEDAAVEVRAETSAGDVTIFGRSDSGVGVSTTRRVGSDDADVTYVLDLEVGLGQVEIVYGPVDRRAATTTTVTGLG